MAMAVSDIYYIFIGVIVPVLYYVYNKYITAQPNNYNKIEAPVKITLPIPEEARPHWKGKRLYPPLISIPNEPDKIQSYCPATGQYLGVFNCTTREDMDEMINNASKAQKNGQTLLSACEENC